jgi:hypothetical protein
MDTWERDGIPDLVELALCLIDVDKVPTMLGMGSYFACSFLLLCSYGYRIWLERLSVKADFTFRKTVFKYGRSDREVVVPDAEPVHEYEMVPGSTWQNENDAAASPAPSAPPDDLQCDYNCGFRGSYDEVLEHEQTCSDATVASAPSAPPAVLECDYNCGFRGSYDEVLEHEQTCSDGPAFI